MSGPYFFGLHKGHLTQTADQIAKRYGATHVNFTDPGGEKRGWFQCPNMGAPWDARTAATVMTAIEQAGGIDGLRKKRGGGR